MEPAEWYDRHVILRDTRYSKKVGDRMAKWEADFAAIEVDAMLTHAQSVLAECLQSVKMQSDAAILFAFDEARSICNVPHGTAGRPLFYYLRLSFQAMPRTSPSCCAVLLDTTSRLSDYLPPKLSRSFGAHSRGL